MKDEITKIEQYLSMRRKHVHQKNLGYCQDIVYSVVDLTTKCAHYRRLAGEETIPKGVSVVNVQRGSVLSGVVLCVQGRKKHSKKNTNFLQ